LVGLGGRSTFSILHSQLFNLGHRQQQRRLNLLPHAAADVAIAVEAFDDEEVGIVVLLEDGLFVVGELPVMADVAVGDRDLAEVFCGGGAVDRAVIRYNGISPR
jgi:hypothetical protein